MLSIAVIIPMKPLASSKSRLAPHLSDWQREAIASRMFWTVLEAATASRQISATWVVGGDSAVQRIAAQTGAEWHDDAGAPLNAALEAAFAQWFRREGDAALFLPADLPLVTAQDIDALIAASGKLRSAVFSPALRDGGTNAILMPRDVAFPLQLGEGSFQRHIIESARRSAPIAYHFSRTVGLDVDTIEDLQTWRSLKPDAFITPDSWDLAKSRSEVLRERKEQAFRDH